MIALTFVARFLRSYHTQVRQSLTGRVSAYWDWLPRIDPEVFYFRFAGTLPTHHLYGLATAL